VVFNRSVFRTRKILVIALISIFSLSVFSSGNISAVASTNSAWKSTTNYPIEINGESCVPYSGYIYCVDGYTNGPYTNAVYFAQISSSGVGAWGSTTNYPIALRHLSCAVDSGYIFCVGGLDNNENAREAAYYAQISSSGVGSWKATTRYPVPVEGASCAVSSGYIYCVAGENNTMRDTKYVNYAPVSSNGIGSWKSTAEYPFRAFTSCVAFSSHLYCVGGYASSRAYYARLSSSGLDSWRSTSSYPVRVAGESCVVSSGYIYCVGGSSNSVYYARLSDSGIGRWKSAANYPIAVYAESCSQYASHIYCVGGINSSGFTSDVFYL
jgi:hypothetical protein